MSEWHEAPDQEDAALGAPLAELQTLAESPAVGFLTRIRNRINRRLLAAEAVDLSFTAFFQTFLEYLQALIQAFSSRGREGDRP